jgi:hypothetical protein
MKLLSALTRDPNLIHLEGARPTNQGPIVMMWLVEQARMLLGPERRLSGFRIRFVGEILAGDRVDFEVDDDGDGLDLRALVGERIVARARASGEAS